MFPDISSFLLEILARLLTAVQTERSASSPLLDPVVSPHDLEEAPYSPPSVSPSLRKAPPYRSVMIHTGQFLHEFLIGLLTGGPAERYAEYEKKFPPDM